MLRFELKLHFQSTIDFEFRFIYFYFSQTLIHSLRPSFTVFLGLLQGIHYCLDIQWKIQMLAKNLIIYFRQIPIEFHAVRAIIILCHILCLKAMFYDGLVWVRKERTERKAVSALTTNMSRIWVGIKSWINSEFLRKPFHSRDSDIESSRWIAGIRGDTDGTDGSHILIAWALNAQQSPQTTSLHMNFGRHCYQWNLIELSNHW